MKLEDLERIGDAAHVGMAAHGRNVLTGGPVERLPPHLWEDLRIEFQRRYRNATGEMSAVLVVESGDLPQSPWPASDWAIERIAQLEAALKGLVEDLEMRSKNGVVDCSHGVYCTAQAALSGERITDK